MPIVNRLAEFHKEMTAWRRDLHMHPEIAFEEVRTSGIVAEKLKSWGIEVVTGVGRTGVVGILKGQGSSTRAIGLRADMDALPMEEANDFAHKSTIPNRFHGCGHDGHTATLLGTARYLAETKNFDGTVYFYFQPAEETGGGASAMIDDGLFERFPCESVWGYHNWPGLPLGQIAVKPGPAMAAVDEFRIAVKGYGSHAAYPQRSIDPVVIGSQLVLSLQTLVSRATNPLDAAVVSTTQFNASDAFNVIPDQVTLGGTVRTFRPEVQDLIEAGIRRIATATAEAFGGSAEVSYVRHCAATINHPAESETARDVAAEVVGGENVVWDPEPVMGGEDFSFMLQKKPGNFVFLGGAGGHSAEMPHHPRYDFNDAILPIGASFFARLVERTLPRAG